MLMPEVRAGLKYLGKLQGVQEKQSRKKKPWKGSGGGKWRELYLTHNKKYIK